MSFDSLAFVVLLPLTVLVHWLTPQRWRWVVLLAASYVFYGWRQPALALLILAVTAVSYGAGRMLARTEERAARRLWLGLTILVALGLLGYFKYFNLLGRTAAAVAGLLGGCGTWNAWDIVLPVGVSFYTFQAMSYVVDVYRRTLTAERHFGYYALYISFFPQLVAGPIERAGSLLPQLRSERRPSRRDVHAGCRLLVSGFFRKLVIADLCAPLVNTVYRAANPDGSAVLIGTLLFAAQIYCDFAGYSEIAAGAARLLGVRLMRNFDRPYGACSVREFWRRWHISLTEWFTDYVYIPLGGSRKGLARQVLATFAVFVLSGLWHGAEWSFAAWGLLHGCYMVMELLGRRAMRKLRGDRRDALLPGGAGRVLGRLVTLGAVCFAWIFFRADSIAHALSLVRALFSPWDVRATLALLETATADVGGLTVAAAWALCGFFAALRLPRLTAEEGEPMPDMTWVYLFMAIGLALLIRWNSGGGSAFIYFQF